MPTDLPEKREVRKLGSSLIAQGRDTKEGQAVYWYFVCSLEMGESSRGRLLVR